MTWIPARACKAWACKARRRQAGAEPPAWTGATVWYCPRCGTELDHDGLELWCPADGEQIPWTELGEGF